MRPDHSDARYYLAKAAILNADVDVYFLVQTLTSGTPGSGKFFLQRPGTDTPLFVSTAMPNCHSLALHPEGRRVYIAATNAGSNGNGRPLRDGEYRGNFSPLHLWELPART